MQNGKHHPIRVTGVILCPNKEAHSEPHIWATLLDNEWVLCSATDAKFVLQSEAVLVRYGLCPLCSEKKKEEGWTHVR